MSKLAEQFPHYFKKCPFDVVDVYRVLDLFNVWHPCLQHAVKKLLCAGRRGSKDLRKDVQEAIATLTRMLDMLDEEEQAAEPKEPQ